MRTFQCEKISFVLSATQTTNSLMINLRTEDRERHPRGVAQKLVLFDKWPTEGLLLFA